MKTDNVKERAIMDYIEGKFQDCSNFLSTSVLEIIYGCIKPIYFVHLISETVQYPPLILKRVAWIGLYSTHTKRVISDPSKVGRSFWGDLRTKNNDARWRLIPSNWKEDVKLLSYPLFVINRTLYVTCIP